MAFLAALGLVRLLCAALPSILAWVLAVAAGLIAAGTAAVLAIDRTARRSSPWIEGVDLRTVLKALDLQARFTRFVLDHQGAPAADLQGAFRAFLQAARPGDLSGPTQSPGVVTSPRRGP